MMIDNLVGRMFVGPNGARYTFEGFELLGGGRRNAIMRDAQGNQRRLLDAGLMGRRLVIGFNTSHSWYSMEPLVPAEATELTVSRDVDDHLLWVLTWWVGDDGFEEPLLHAAPDDLATFEAVQRALRITGRPPRDLDVIIPSSIHGGATKTRFKTLEGWFAYVA